MQHFELQAFPLPSVARHAKRRTARVGHQGGRSRQRQQEHVATCRPSSPGKAPRDAAAAVGPVGLFILARPGVIEHSLARTTTAKPIAPHRPRRPRPRRPHEYPLQEIATVSVKSPSRRAGQPVGRAAVGLLQCRARRPRWEHRSPRVALAIERGNREKPSASRPTGGRVAPENPMAARPNRVNATTTRLSTGMAIGEIGDVCWKKVSPIGTSPRCHCQLRIETHSLAGTGCPVRAAAR